MMFGDDAQGRGAAEAFWLKLALLSDLLVIGAKQPLKSQACRVGLDPALLHLPRFWCYRVECSVDSAVDDDAAGVVALWFQVLVENDRQNAEKITGELNQLVAGHGPDSDALLSSVARSPVFQAGQLLWKPPTGIDTGVSAELWSLALRLGVRLLVHPARDELARVAVEAAALATRARSVLFLHPPRLEQELGALLREVIDDPNWLDSIAAGRPAVAPAAAAPMPPPPTPRAPVPEPVEAAENMDATIIVKRGAPAAPRVPAAPTKTPPQVTPAQPPPAAAESDVDATIIVSKKGAVPAGPSRPVVTQAATVTPPPQETEGLEETIIISKDKKR